MKVNFFAKNKISASRKKLLLDFQKNNNLNFKDISLLDLAFTHRSVVNENSFLHENNERVEFLGDAVLEMVTAAYLYEKYKTESEGDLAKIKSAVVSEASLADIGLKLGVDRCLLLGKGEENTGGRKKKAILADCVEAIIGAYYLDSGYKATEKFILLWMIAVVEGFKQNPALKDYKTQLQELCQKQFKVCPKYQMIKKSGPDHNRTFWMSVDINGTVFGPAKGKNKKEAEQSVAKIALNNFEK